MLYPSIQELLNATSKDGKEKLNKYSLTMATAKCARVVTNDYLEQRYNAEKKISNKETDKDFLSLVNREYRDEKSVKNAVKEINEGKFEILLPGEEGYEDSIVEVVDYQEPKVETFFMEKKEEDKTEQEDEETNEIEEIMDIEEVYEDGYDEAEGFYVEGDE
ncbi:MAG: hypothetical protein IJW54_06860 [Clostridia bacterium]|nr:hypothetical protein [Clostridia bacterium]